MTRQSGLCSRGKEAVAELAVLAVPSSGTTMTQRSQSLQLGACFAWRPDSPVRRRWSGRTG